MKLGGWSVGQILILAAVVIAVVAVSGTNAMERRTGHKLSRAAKRHLIDKRPPDLKSYHSASQLTAKFKALSANCPHLKIDTRKGDKKSLLSVTISRPDTPANAAAAAAADDKLKVLMFFGEHARELISPETALRFTQMLCSHTPAGVIAPSAEWQSRIGALLDSSDILMFPLINVDGHNKVTRGSYCTRTNRKGVDLNRNWDDHWKRSLRADTNSGRKAFSEDEVRILRDAAHHFRPDMFVSIHSGALGMYTPFAYSTARPSGAVERKMVSILKHLNHKHSDVEGSDASTGYGYCNCDVGAAGKELNYLCPGTCLDYMFDKLKTPYAFAVEIWDGAYGFRKQPKSTRAQTAAMWKNALIESSSAASAAAATTSTVKSSLTHDPTSEHLVPVSMAQADAINAGSCFISHDRSELRESMRHHSDAPASEAESEAESEDSEWSDSFVEENESSHALFPPPRNSEDHSCLAMFNPTNTPDYVATTENWSRLLIELIENVKSKPERAPRF